MAEYREDAEVGILTTWPMGPSGMRNGANPYGSMAVVFDLTPEQNQKMFEILDFTLSPEGTHLNLHGIEGVHYTMDGDTMNVIQGRRQNDFHGIEHHFIRHFAFPGITKEYLMQPLDANYIDIQSRGVPPAIVGLNTETTSWLEPNLRSVRERWINDFISGDADIDTDFQRFLDEYMDTGFQQMLDEVRAFAGQ